MNRQNMSPAVVLALGALASQPVSAVDWDVSGLVRVEAAYKTSNDLNPLNWAGNTMNGVAASNTGLGPILAPGVSPTTLTRSASQTEENDFNFLATRLELDVNGQLSDNWALRAKLRAFADHTGSVEDAFDGINIFEQEFDGTGGTPLESADKDWMVDLPVAYLDYSDGPVWLRMGNQQIAWGEAIFFRVADAPNGLDLRRHSVFDVAAEEYADKRVPALGVRGSYRINDTLELEGFVQQFQPSILSGENSPYNPIAAQFVVQQKPGFEDVDDKLNIGAKLRFETDTLEGQFFVIRRHDPNGVYRWTQTGVNDSRLGSAAPVLAQTAFEPLSGVGVHSAEEWFEYASLLRLDGLGGLETALNEFPATELLDASTVAAACGAPSSMPGAIQVDQASASCILDTFFDGTPGVGLGDLRGHLVREYKDENVIGFSLNTVFEGEPDSLLDQLIGRFELSYTPDKVFTAPSLSRDFIVEDELQFAFIFEKYHKFSADVPATYVVAQWLHKSESDIFGRHLSGMNNKPGAAPEGADNFNAIAIALQQPSPTLAWRFDLSVLTDLQGGWLIQPGVRWRPIGDVQVDLYANILESDGGGDDFAEGLEYANEVFTRVSWFF